SCNRSNNRCRRGSGRSPPPECVSSPTWPERGSESGTQWRNGTKPVIVAEIPSAHSHSNHLSNLIHRFRHEVEFGCAVVGAGPVGEVDSGKSDSLRAKGDQFEATD